MPGVAAALDSIESSGFTTMWPQRHAREDTPALGITGLYRRFEGRIHSATEVEHGKPAPDLFLHAAAAMGFTPDRCVVVEDSRSGVQAARAAGMRSLGFAGGLTPSDWLEGPGTTVYEDMADLPALVESLVTEWD
ncbi:MAG: HAD-IA family hydrolase [Microthrixaceae bacterium]